MVDQTRQSTQEFNNGPSKTCGRQPLKDLKEYDLLKVEHTPSNFLKAVFHKFYLVHSGTPCIKCER